MANQEWNGFRNRGGKSVEVMGHRGAAGSAPENTLLAFAQGLELGVDGFEFDVQLTRDGEIVICHDERLDRTSDGLGWLKDYSLKELKRFNFGVRFGVYAPIPTLEELLDLVLEVPPRKHGGKGFLLNVELKSGLIPYPGLGDKVVECLGQYGMLGQSIISSFDHAPLLELSRHFPGVETGVLYASGLLHPWEYAGLLGAKHLHPHLAFVDQNLVSEAHRRGLGVNVWTVNEPWEIERVCKAGVDRVITDFPERFCR